jgi:hypothetical protein
LLRTLLSHRHNDVSDLQISNLVQPTSVRPVTVSAISLHFRKLVVRFLKFLTLFPLRDRSASRMANSFSSRTDSTSFNPKSTQAISPPAVMMSPSSIISFSVSTRISGNRSASVSENDQCVVADRPFNSPVFARRKAPPQTEQTIQPEACCVSTHS